MNGNGTPVAVPLGLIVLVGVAMLAGTPLASGAGSPVLAQQDVDADQVVMSATLQPSGDASWRVAYRVRLASDADVQAFENLQTDVQENTSLYVERFRQRMNGTVANAARETGREMAVANVTVTAERLALTQDYGVLAYRFRWTNFAAVDGERLRAGDALAGLFLDNQTSLEIAWPANYTARTVDPPADDRSDGLARWRGPQEFGPSGPTVVVAPADATSDGGLPAWLLGGAGLLAITLVVFVVARRRGLLGGGTGQPADGGGPSSGGESGAAEPNVSASAETAGAAATADTAGGETSTAADEPPSELLSNEERVLKVLEREGGRIKQQALAERLDWTAAKTSQVIGDMREDDAVETFRLGRENVVTLPDTGLGDDLGPDESGQGADGGPE